jgi:hypothetical protein
MVEFQISFMALVNKTTDSDNKLNISSYIGFTDDSTALVLVKI